MDNHYLDLIQFYRELTKDVKTNKHTILAVKKLIKTEDENIKNC